MKIDDQARLKELIALQNQAEHKAKVILAALSEDNGGNPPGTAELFGVCSVLGGTIETIIEIQPEKKEAISNLLVVAFKDYLVVGELH